MVIIGYPDLQKITSEIIIYASVHQDPFISGGPVHTRVNLEHPVKGCKYSVSWPTGPVTLNTIMDEYTLHLRKCPLIKRDPYDDES